MSFRFLAGFTDHVPIGRRLLQLVPNYADDIDLDDIDMYLHSKADDDIHSGQGYVSHPLERLCWISHIVSKAFYVIKNLT